MSLDKNRTIAEVGQRTRLRNHDTQKMLEALIEIWTKELAQGGRIEVENFLVLEVQHIDRGSKPECCSSAVDFAKLPASSRN